MLAFILLQLIPVAVGAFLLFCVGKSIAKCSGTARCLAVSIIVSVLALALAEGSLLLIGNLSSQALQNSVAFGLLLWSSYGVPNLLVSWFGLRCGYADEAGVHLSAVKSLLFAIVFVIVQSATAFGATLIWVIDFMTFTMHFC